MVREADGKMYAGRSYRQDSPEVFQNIKRSACAAGSKLDPILLVTWNKAVEKHSQQNVCRISLYEARKLDVKTLIAVDVKLVTKVSFRHHDLEQISSNVVQRRVLLF